jgi:hypothetical protein
MTPPGQRGTAGLTLLLTLLLALLGYYWRYIDDIGNHR